MKFNFKYFPMQRRFKSERLADTRQNGPTNVRSVDFNERVTIRRLHI